MVEKGGGGGGVKFIDFILPYYMYIHILLLWIIEQEIFHLVALSIY